MTLYNPITYLLIKNDHYIIRYIILWKERQNRTLIMSHLKNRTLSHGSNTHIIGLWAMAQTPQNGPLSHGSNPHLTCRFSHDFYGIQSDCGFWKPLKIWSDFLILESREGVKKDTKTSLFFISLLGGREGVQVYWDIFFMETLYFFGGFLCKLIFTLL